MKPEIVIMTTPNITFNKFFGNKENELRNSDHKFEFTEEQFLYFC
jgi:hypothetical protein